MVADEVAGQTENKVKHYPTINRWMNGKPVQPVLLPRNDQILCKSMAKTTEARILLK